MKKSPFYALLAFLFLTTTASTCSHDDDDDDHGHHSSSIQQTVNTVNTGTWRISYYFDSDHEETAQFSGYDFTFGTNGQITADNGSNVYTGSWSVTDSRGFSRSGDDDSHVHFNIGFSSPASFSELTDDWEIVSRTATRIELMDVSGGNGGTDFLTFEKN